MTRRSRRSEQGTSCSGGSSEDQKSADGAPALIPLVGMIERIVGPVLVVNPMGRPLYCVRAFETP